MILVGVSATRSQGPKDPQEVGPLFYFLLTSPSYRPAFKSLLSRNNWGEMYRLLLINHIGTVNKFRFKFKFRFPYQFDFFIVFSPQQWRPPPERKHFWLLIKNKKQLHSSRLYWPQPCCSTVVALYHCRAGYSALCKYIGRGTPLSCFVSFSFAILFLTVISMPGLLHNILDKCQQLCPPFQWILWALIYITDTANMSA